jgi:hypothetical protein
MDRHNASIFDQVAFDSSEYWRLLKKCVQCRLKETPQMNQMNDVTHIRGGSSSHSIEVVIRQHVNIMSSEQLSRDWPSN